MNEQEMLDKIDELESRIAALESSCETCNDDDEETCPECGENPCICDQIPKDDEEGPIDDDDVEEIEELDFSVPNFGGITDEENEIGGMFPVDEEEEEDSPYYG